MAMKVTGIEEIKANIQKLVNMTSNRTAKNSLERGVKNALQPMQDMAKALSPSHSVETSIKIDTKLDPKIRAAREKKEADLIRVHVGSTSNLAHLFEYGTAMRFHKNGKSTGRMTPDPFMRPAFDSTHEQVFQNMSDELAKAIQASITRATKAGK